MNPFRRIRRAALSRLTSLPPARQGGFGNAVETSVWLTSPGPGLVLGAAPWGASFRRVLVIPAPRRSILNHVLIVLVLLVAAMAAWRVRWVCDDIFITLRYVDNSLAGKGVVFNQGERVEGYTHFLWFLLLAGAQAIGFDPVQTCMALGVVAYLGTLGAFAWVGARLHRGGGKIYLPFTALALALNHDFRLWATSGLETSLFTFLLAAAFTLWFFVRIDRLPRLLGSGLLVILAVMTRPDGALFFLLANVFLLGSAGVMRRGVKGYLREFLAFNAAFFLLYIPYTIWKVVYYGSIFPNTYYAKAASIPYWSQGFYYIALFFRVYWSAGLFMISGGILVWMWVRARRLAERNESSGGRLGAIRALLTDPVMAALLFALAGSVTYLVFFVAKVGGDFMFARFVIPVLPFLYFSIEAGVLLVLSRRPASIPVVFLILLAAVGLERFNRDVVYPNKTLVNPKPDDVFQHRGIADEHWYYTARINYNHTLSMIETGEIVGRFLEPYFEGLDATFLLSSQNVIAYYGRFQTCIEKNGLTDAFIAHRPITPEERRAVRTGHVKFPTYRYLIDRGTDFSLLYHPPALRPFQHAKFILPDGMEIPVAVLTYDRRLIDKLRHRCGKDFECVDFEAWLDRYIARDLPAKNLEDLRKDYLVFRDYYFRWNEDSPRERPFLEVLGEAVKETPTPGTLQPISDDYLRTH